MFRNLKRHGYKPRANNDTLTPPEIVGNLRKLLLKHKEIPLYLVSTVYKAHFGEPLCCVEMGHSHGLPGLLWSLGDMVEIARDESGLSVVSLARNNMNFYQNGAPSGGETNENHRLSQEDQHKRRLYDKSLFEPTSFLWTNKSCAKLLSRRGDIVIDKSGFEMALESRTNQVKIEVMKIRNYLKQYPKGVRLSEMAINLNKRLFNIATSLNALVLELPEVFYRQETADGEAIIFDGFSHSVNLEQRIAVSADDEPADRKTVTEAINTGLYQKTLLLIRETGLRGLKLNVWHKSMLNNFHTHDSPEEAEKIIYNISVIPFFVALARFGLVELRSAAYSRNDIRAYLPRGLVEYLGLKAKLRGLLDFDDLSNSNQEDKFKLRGRRARTIAVLLKANENIPK